MTKSSFRGIWALLALTSGFSSSGYALEKALVLPKGVRNPVIRFGQIHNFGDRFQSDGLLMGTAESQSRVFDARNIVAEKPEAQKLVDALNEFGPYRLGDRVNSGVLDLRAKPEATYWAPVFGYGITDNWSVGFGIPFIRYKVEASYSHNLNSANIDEIARQLPDVRELQAQIQKFKQNVAEAFAARLSANGYKPFAGYETSYVGDLVLQSLYRYQNSSLWDGVVKVTFTLPTGPKDDPDDLLDIPLFGQTSIAFSFVQDLKVSDSWVFGGYSGYAFRVADRITKRVPRYEGDSLPSADQKEELHRDLGDVWTLGTNARWSITRYLELGTGIEHNTKSEDRYWGDRGLNYSLLSKNTASQWQRAIVSLEFSTIDLYLRNVFAFPFTVTYEYSDYFSGINVERQTVHELGLRAYF